MPSQRLGRAARANARTAHPPFAHKLKFDPPWSTR
jgi:hypothetical protein